MKHLCLFFLIITAGQAMASLQITPQRVVFEGKTRSMALTLTNKSGSTKIFRASFDHLRMTEDGRLEPVEKEETGMWVDHMIRMAPRQVRLAPGESQVVRLLLRRPGKLEEGEYRSHLLFRELPSAEMGFDVTRVEEDQKDIGVKLVALTSVSLPVIVRQGRLQANVSFDHLEAGKATEAELPLSMTFMRQGSQSVYGNVVVSYLPEKGDEVLLTKAKGLGIYTDVTLRSFDLNARIPEGVTLGQGRIRVQYRSPLKDGDRLLAEAFVTL